jgi:PKD repeat protein/photosystem II stability/assembly factor-like uncharacterized protein
MKKLFFLLATLPMALFGQVWMQNIPADKAQNGTLTFTDIQQVFYNYEKEHGVINGKMLVNGRQEKVPGWKQFKRWEYFWEQRVDATTGTFPKVHAADIMEQYAASHLNGKSSLGNWVTVGPSVSDGGYAGIGRVNCVAFHPTDNNTFWVGTPSGGLWKTTDGGGTWTVLTDGNKVLGVSDIAIPSDYATSNTIYIATGDKDGGSVWSLGGGSSADNNSVGVLKSTDGGATWNTTGLSYLASQGKLIGRLLIHPTNTNTLLAGTNEGIYKTTDGGTNWTSEYTGTYIIDMEFKAGDPSVIYASNKDYWGVARIIKSADTGGTWSTIKSFADTDYRVEIAVTAHDANYMYAIVANRNSGLTGIYKSTDGGSAFTQLVNGNDANKSYLYYYSDGSGENSGQGSYDLTIAVSPSDKNRVIIGGVNSWKTTDGGTTWNICNMWTSYSGYNFSGAPEVHADKHIHVYRADGTLFEGNDGGIYKSTNSGTSWTDLSNGIVNSQIYRLSVSQTDNNMTINGLQDNGSKLVDGTFWYDVTGGDGMECIIDYTNKNTQYATYVNGTIYRTNDLWNNYVTISDNIGGSGAWVTPYIIDPNNNSTLYVGYADVWKTTNKGDSFTKISTINTADLIRSMAIAPSNSNYVYVADHDNLWKTTNGGTSWTEITGTLPVSTNNITYLAVKNSDENTIWVSMGGYNTQKVYQSTNGGTTWTSISTGLPSLPVMCVIQNKMQTSVDQLYAGTDGGVFVKNGTDDWQLFSQGLPNVVVTELDIYYNTTTPESSKLRAATFGRGLWESDLYSVPAVAPVAAFTANATSISQGQTVTFTDGSTNGPTSWDWTFAGGTPSSSVQQNPQVVYDVAGTYDVVLTATNEAGSDTETKVGYITVNPAVAPVAGFTADKTLIFAGQNITFSDTSLNNPTSWSWAFAGGTPALSTLQNPVVAYSTEGSYDVSLTVTNAGGSHQVEKVGYITVEALPAFPAPSNLTATATINSVDLNWEAPVVDTLLSEGFEGTWPPAGWSVNYSATLTGTQSPPTGATWFHCDENSFANGPHPEYIHTGVYSAAIGYTAPEFNWLITPEFVPDLASYLSFWIWYWSDASGGFITKFQVMVYDNATWTSLLTMDNSTFSNEFDTPVEISLAAYASKTIQIAFVYEYNDGYQLMVDDVAVAKKASGYQIYRNAQALVKLSDASLETYTDAGLTPNTYEYYISALYNNQLNESDTSNHAKATVYGQSVAAFSAVPVTGVAPLDVTFSNTSQNAISYSWDFGDESTSTETNPVHTFTQPGNYTVVLTASNPMNSDTETKTGYIKATLPEVTAGFSAAPTTGTFPFDVSFTNTSGNATSYTWNFGDGETSTDENPVHSYQTAGNFTVSLTASNSDFTDTETKANYIEALWPAPMAKFLAEPTSGIDPLVVTFTDSSEYAQSWNWNFGDGNTSTLQNPVNTYTKGTYSVTLQVTNPTGSNSITKENLIVVDPNSIPEEWKERIQVYPNPASDKITIIIVNSEFQDVSVELYDLSGKLIYHSPVTQKTFVEEKIEVGHLDKANYLVKISIDDAVIVTGIAVK